MPKRVQCVLALTHEYVLILANPPLSLQRKLRVNVQDIKAIDPNIITRRVLKEWVQLLTEMQTGLSNTLPSQAVV